MAPFSAAPALMFLLISAITAGQRVSSEPQPQPTCPWKSAPFICRLQHQCPISISPNPPIQVDGDFLDRFLETNHQDRYSSILFYASWCPFSEAARSTYEALSSMFPQIDHLAIEQSSVMPSVFSRYGIHSVPAILLVNQTSRSRYRGPRTLISLAQFYEQNTGLEPVTFMVDQPVTLQTDKAPIMNFLSGLPVKEIARKEPYLTFAVLFLCLRLLFAVSPKVLFHVKAIWVLYIPRLNLGVFGETSQIMGRILPAVDIKRMWTKLGVFKVRNFYASARNARVWASSLASVSIGQSSSARPVSN